MSSIKMLNLIVILSEELTLEVIAYLLFKLHTQNTIIHEQNILIAQIASETKVSQTILEVLSLQTLNCKICALKHISTCICVWREEGKRRGEGECMDILVEREKSELQRQVLPNTFIFLSILLFIVKKTLSFIHASTSSTSL